MHPQRRTIRTRLVAVAALALVTGTVTAVLRGADHADSPDTDQGNLDINDVYAFVQDDDEIVLIMTVAPLLTPGEATDDARLNPRGLYEFKLDVERDGVPEAVIQVVPAGRGAHQRVIVRGPAAPQSVGTTSRLVRGPSARGRFGHEIEGDDLTAWVGPADDPFFINLFGDESLVSVLNGVFEAALGVEVGEPDQVSFADPGVDDLAGLNTLAIVVELEKEELADALGIDEEGTFFVWGTTSLR